MRSRSSLERRVASAAACAVLVTAAPTKALAATSFDFAHLASLRRVEEAVVSPDAKTVAHVTEVPRRPGVDEDGPAWRELHVIPFAGGEARAWVHGQADVTDVVWSADGRALFYRAKRGKDEHRTVWRIPFDGGESRRAVEHAADIEAFAVSPDGKQIAFVAPEPKSGQRKRIVKKGYKQEVYEEDWSPHRLWLAPVGPPPAPPDPLAGEDEAGAPRALDLEGSAFEVRWSPDGKRLAVTVAPTPLIDDRYMARRIHVLDAGTGKLLLEIDNPGKLGEFAWSPDGRHLALISAADRHDPKEGRLLVASLATGGLRDLLPGLEGHVRALAWQNASTVMYVADVGVATALGEVDIATGKRRVHLEPAGSAPVLSSLSLSADGRNAAFIAEAPAHPPEVYAMTHGDRQPRRLTTTNPWLASLELARQTTFRWRARDGVELEGVLLHPLSAPAAPARAPLLLMVHGGPEAHDRNGWVTSYSRPGQLAAARGYTVLYPNYRGSTGRGVAFSKSGQGDAAGPEFDDLIDAVDAAVEQGLADRDRVGITGGSYGGYATAWCATRFTDRFRAGVMFVGISDRMSQGYTTDIPREEVDVHALEPLSEGWAEKRERSPLYHAAGSHTALLIAAGTSDTRVDPSQSLELYRALKLAGKAPVRYVRYPGEGHGNRSAAARDDYTRRLLQWMDHFVLNRGEGLPPWELSLPHLVDDDEDPDE